MTSPSADKNVLNVRVKVTRTVAAEIDLPSGVTLQDAIAQLNEALDLPKSQGSTKSSAPTGPQGPETVDESEIAKATWKPQARGGDWTFGHELPHMAEALERADKQTLVAAGFRFKLWKDNEGVARVSRWPHKAD